MTLIEQAPATGAPSRYAGYALVLALFALPLYPKVGLVSVPNTYIPVRFDDIVVAVLGAIWVAALILERRRPSYPRLVGRAAVAWLAVTFVALGIGAFVLNSISPLTGFAYWAKPIEYLLLGLVTYDLVVARAVRLRNLVAVILAAAAIVVVYGLLQHFQLVPAPPGIRPPPGGVTSLFGDFHELAGYLGIVMLLVVALFATSGVRRTAPLPVRIGAAAIVIAAVAGTLYYTAVRTEYLALGLTLGFLFIVVRGVRIPAAVGVAFMALLFVSPNLSATVGAAPPVGTRPPPSVTTRYNDSSFSYSWNERFNQKWPLLWNKTIATNPITGLGPSAATEAADGYYMRSFTEAGVVGLAVFLALLGAVAVSLWRGYRAATQSSLARALALTVLSSTVFLAAVGVLIDVWVASRVMELYWPLVGAALAATAMVTAADERSVDPQSSTASATIAPVGG